MLSEKQVERSWNQIFSGQFNDDAFDRADELLDELRPESPLRHRLAGEMQELRELHVARSEA